MVEIIPNWHPFFVHFTVALLTLSFVFYVLGVVWQNSSYREQWLTYGNWNLWLGVAFSAITVIAGWFAYNSVTHDTPSHAAMTVHRNWALATFAVFALMVVWTLYMRRQKTQPTTLFLVLGFVGLVLLTTTGWRGAELVYRYGLGVMSLPKVEDHSHAGAQHGHDDQHQSDSEGHHEPLDAPTSKPNTSHETPEKTTHHDDGHNHDHTH